jgi:hypothetical protein
LFVNLRAELYSQWKITESAQIKNNKIAIKQVQGQNKETEVIESVKVISI